MDIVAALKQEAAKLQQQLDTVRAAMKVLGIASGGKTTRRKKRVMSAAARAKISRAAKKRWAKLRALKGKA